MKVYELISKLVKACAGAEVLVALHATLNSPAEDVSLDVGTGIDDELGTVLITGGDPMLISDSGEEIAKLSEIAENHD